MNLLSQIIVGCIAVLHIYILWLEMFAWTTRAKKVFKTIPVDQFEKTKVLAANQGLYNGFLAAGLIWSLLISDATWSKNVALFFLGCVLVAGIYGAMTASKRIFFVQAVPAILGILSLFLINYSYNIQNKNINKPISATKKKLKADKFSEVRKNSDKIVIKFYQIKNPDTVEDLKNVVWRKSIIDNKKLIEFDSFFKNIKNGGYCCCPRTNYTITFYKNNSEIKTYNVDIENSEDKVLFFDRSYQSSYYIYVEKWNSFLSSL